MKTNQFNLHQSIQQLQGRLNPVITFIQNLEKQLAEEENTEENTESKKKGDCGCGKKKK